MILFTHFKLYSKYYLSYFDYHVDINYVNYFVVEIHSVESHVLVILNSSNTARYPNLCVVYTQVGLDPIALKLEIAKIFRNPLPTAASIHLRQAKAQMVSSGRTQ